ncbi:MAG: molybdopterin converting factor subunit 1 [Pseudomonadales bacterium]|nr:molybdopterin converting factor subunit 1 [Pseudomonadales bacterium]
MIEIRFFAALRERVGSDSLTVSPPDSVDTVAKLVAWLEEEPALAEALAATPRRMVAVNEELASEETTIAGGDVVALFPPVTGG